VLPPLDADFFRLAQHLDEKVYGKYARPVLEFLRSEYGPHGLPTLETVFTELQGFERFLRQFSTGPGRRTSRYQKQLSYLQDLIPAVFRSALDGMTCDWHDRIAQALRSGDAVISFNYDTLIDDSLRRWARGIWDADRGYGFRIGTGGDAWSAASTPGPFPREYPRLLKPHGSLHWSNIDVIEETVDLRRNAYAQRSAKTNIIPPTWDKTVLGNWPWKPVWEQASRYLQQVRCLIVIGYSVPPTDLMSQALIKSSLGNADLRLLLVVNPDPLARGRVIDLARPAIRAKTRVIELGALRDFALLLDETPGERSRRAAQLRPLRREIRKLQRRLDYYREDELWDLDSSVDDLETLAERVAQLEAKKD
jgi:SIR2-like domain